MTVKKPRRYYTVKIAANNGEAETYAHLTKLNATNAVKMALDIIEDDTSASLFINIEHEPEKLSKMLLATRVGQKRYEP